MGHMSDSKNEGCCIRELKYRLFMARSLFSLATAAIKTLKYAFSGSGLDIITELCLFIRREKISVETKKAEISAAAGHPGAPTRSQNSTARFPAASGYSTAGLPVREPSQAPSRAGNSWDGVQPRSQLAGWPCPAGGAIPGECGHVWLSRGTLALPHHLGVQAEFESPGHPQISGEGEVF